MSVFPNFPRLIKGGILLVDPDSGTAQKIIVLQRNPDTKLLEDCGHLDVSSGFGPAITKPFEEAGFVCQSHGSSSTT
jgi:hypothetical protein